MVIAHNLMSMNATRMFGINNGQIVKSIEKLSSGLCVNRSADDAAGLAISEKMRTQIRGLNRASLNAQDGISVIQVAEGAYGEMQDMLHRINELCTQAANDTNTDEDRKQIQQEIDQLVYEIDDTTDRTQFNTKKILAGVNKYKADGSVDHDAVGEPGKRTYYTAKNNLTGVFQSGAVPVNIDPEAGVTSIELQAGGIQLNGTAFGVDENLNGAVPMTVTPDMQQRSVNTIVDYSAFNYKRPGQVMGNISVIFGTKSADGTNNYYSDDFLLDYMKRLKDHGIDYGYEGYAKGFDGVESRIRRDYGEEIKNVGISVENGIRTLNLETWADQNDPFKMMLQVGALPNQGIEIEIEHLNARGLGITGLFVDSFEDAGAAMKKVQDAIDKVSTARANLGAQQNRLEHTIKNLDNIAENTQAAESRIRDTDMAKEMVNYSKLQILAQAGQSVISNSQRSNEGVLMLLSA